jgi:hypothetical protein
MKRKKEFVLITVMFITFLVLFQLAFVSAITGSMGNARMVLYPEVNGITNTIIEKSILVKNVNDVPITVKLEVEESSVDFLELMEEEITLEPGTDKRVEFEVKIKKPGKYEGKINVYFSEVDGDGPGVALASNIIIIAKNPKDIDEPETPEEPEEPITQDPVTGNAVGSEDDKNPMGVILTITTVILVIALILLYLLSEQKRKKSVSTQSDEQKRKKKVDKKKVKNKPKKSKEINEKPKQKKK